MPARHPSNPNPTVFLTQVTANRARLFADPSLVDLLLSNLRETKMHQPFTMIAFVILPDHFHLLIRPDTDMSFSRIMASLKNNFTRDFKTLRDIEYRFGVWQRNFWDHQIRDQDDLNRHINYIHYNPVRHGWAVHPEDWRHSSYAEWRRRGAYPDRWGWSLGEDATWMATGGVINDVE